MDGSVRPWTDGCPACEGHRLHFASEWERHHPSLWAKLSERDRRALLSLRPEVAR